MTVNVASDMSIVRAQSQKYRLLSNKIVVMFNETDIQALYMS